MYILIGEIYIEGRMQSSLATKSFPYNSLYSSNVWAVKRNCYLQLYGNQEMA